MKQNNNNKRQDVKSVPTFDASFPEGVVGSSGAAQVQP